MTPARFLGADIGLGCGEMGVRPSSGAAPSAARAAVEYSGARARSVAAAPEDGRTPAICPDDCV